MLDTATQGLFNDMHAEQAKLAAIDMLHHATNFYTVTPVVEELLGELGWPECRGNLLDPAVGNGQFLVRAVEMLLEHHAVADEELASMVEGWEIHAGACHEARARLANALMRYGRTYTAAQGLASKIVKNRDFLTEARHTGKFALVASNPPFLRRTKVPALLRDEYDASVPAYARQDLLHGFLDACARAIRPDGQIGVVSADRWLYAKGAEKLREKLGERLSIRHLGKLDAKCAFFRPKSRKAGTPPRVNPVSVVLAPGSGVALSKAPVYPSASNTDFSCYPKLRELATVNLSPFLGPRGIFLLTWEEAIAKAIPESVLIPAIGADDIVDDVLQAPKYFAIRTSPNEAPCDAVMTHLTAAMHRMPKGSRRKTAWIPPETFHRRALNQPCLLVRRIGRTPKGIRLQAGLLGIDHHLIITPHDPAQLEAIECALMAPIAQKWIEERARPLEEDFFELTADVLRDMPIDLTAN